MIVMIWARARCAIATIAGQWIATANKATAISTKNGVALRAAPFHIRGAIAHRPLLALSGHWRGNLVRSYGHLDKARALTGPG